MVRSTIAPIEIVIDSNEASSEKAYIKHIRSVGEKLKQPVHVYQLSVGNIKIGDVIIEYKTPHDFISYSDGTIRVLNQAKRLAELRKQGYQPIVVIVGNFGVLIKRHKGKKFYSRILPQYYGLMNTISMKWSIPVLSFSTTEHFNTWLTVTIKKQIYSRGFTHYSLRHTPSRINSIEEEIQYILQGFKGIGGAKTAKLIKAGTNNLIETLLEIAYPVLPPENSLDSDSTDFIDDVNILAKWESVLGKSTFAHIREVLLHSFKKEESK